MSNEEQSKGVSLILVQSDKGCELIEKADLILKDVDINNAVANNKQLEHPSVKPVKYDSFFKSLKSGTSYNKSICKAYKKQYIKQLIKKILIKCKLR